MSRAKHATAALTALEGGQAGGEPLAANGVAQRAREELATADAALVTALVAGRSYRQAAEVVGMSERTIARRMSDPSFRSLVEAGRLELLDSGLGLLLGSAELAILVLRNVAGRGQPVDAVRAAAANALLDRIPRWHEHVALARRLDALERALEGQS